MFLLGKLALLVVLAQLGYCIAIIEPITLCRARRVEPITQYGRARSVEPISLAGRALEASSQYLYLYLYLYYSYAGV